MADFQLLGRIEGCRYGETNVTVTLSEYKAGFKKNDGTRVEEKYITWKCIFKPYFKKFISSHFTSGMLVLVKGEIFPYAIHNGEETEGYSMLGQTINLASFPKNLRREIKMLKESQAHSTGTPNLEDYNTPDF